MSSMDSPQIRNKKTGNCSSSKAQQSMKRSTKIFGSIGLYLIVLWYLLTLNLPDILRTYLVFSPFILVVLFGLYSVFVILVRLVNFPECPGEAKKLDEDISEALKDLKTRGYVHTTKKDK